MQRRQEDPLINENSTLATKHANEKDFKKYINDLGFVWLERGE